MPGWSTASGWPGGCPGSCPAPRPGGWATDPGELAAAIGPRTAAVLLMSPVMPTGAVLSAEHLDAIVGPVTSGNSADALACAKSRRCGRRSKPFGLPTRRRTERERGGYFDQPSRGA
jgi:hypothetical protein